MHPLVCFALLLSFISIQPSLGVSPTCEKQPRFAEVAGVPVANLTVKLYKNLVSRNPDSNIVFSPLSVMLTLALLEKGAGGATQTLLERTLAAPGVDHDVRRVYESLQVQLKSENVKSELNIANALFYGQGITVKRDFLTKSQCLGTEVQKVNFQQKAAARQKINSWVAEKTNDKITDLLKADAISERTQAVLTNAVYLKAAWQDTFTSLSGTFYQNGRASDRKEVPFIRHTGTHGYFADDTYHVVALPYTDRKLLLLIALPKSRGGIVGMETLMTEERINPLLLHLNPELVDVQLPKFTIKTSAKLTAALSEIGLAHIFSGAADFSRMTDQSIKFDDVVHEAFVKVNENGTEAAAATAAISNRRLPARPSGNPKQFIADHPFIFAIVHPSTGTLIFIGKVNAL